MIGLRLGLRGRRRPPTSRVLQAHLRSCDFPPWTSFFVAYADVRDDHFARSHFNFQPAPNHNYHILRTGCWPYIKYHATKRPKQDLSFDDSFFRVLKVLNLGQ